LTPLRSASNGQTPLPGAATMRLATNGVNEGKAKVAVSYTPRRPGQCVAGQKTQIGPTSARKTDSHAEADSIIWNRELAERSRNET
jgi:hypothetical protein